MEDRHLIKDLFYLSVGSAAMAVHKTEELIEKLVESNKVTREEGERIVHNYYKKAEEATRDIQQRKDDLIELLHEKVQWSKEELRAMIDHIMEQPFEAKATLNERLRKLTEELSETTKLTRQEAKGILEYFIDEMNTVQGLLKAHYHRMLEEMENKAIHLKDQGMAFFSDLDAQTRLVREELKEKVQLALDRLRIKLHIASAQRVATLEKRQVT